MQSTTVSVTQASDELADVQLDGVTLVADDHRRWIVPAEAAQFDSVFDWWQHLAARDHQLPNGAGTYVKEILDKCPTHVGRMGHGQRRHASRQRTNLCVERLLEMQFTLEQISDVTGFTCDQLLGAEMHKAYRALLAGRSASEAHAQAPSTTFREVKRFARIVAGEPVKRLYPKTMRQEAFTLLDEGLSLRQVADVLNERHGTNLNDKTVGTWHSRYRLRAKKVK